MNWAWSLVLELFISWNNYRSLLLSCAPTSRSFGISSVVDTDCSGTVRALVSLQFFWLSPRRSQWRSVWNSRIKSFSVYFLGCRNTWKLLACTLSERFLGLLPLWLYDCRWSSKIFKRSLNFDVFELISLSWAAILSPLRIFEGNFRCWVPSHLCEITLIFDKSLWLCSSHALSASTSFSALLCWSRRWVLLQNSCRTLHSNLFVLFRCHCKSKSNNKLMTKCNSWNSLAIERVYSLGSGSFFVVTVAELSIII